jgi:O-antigen/teichoic acid export membrane protein
MMITGIFLVPLYLKYISVETYGAWLATGNILLWITIIDPGISLVLQQKISYSYGKNDIETIVDIIASGLFITFFITIIIFILGYVLSFYIVDLLNNHSKIDFTQLRSAFLLALVGSCLMIFSYSITSINQGLQSSIGIGLVYAITNIFSILISALMLKRNYGVISLAILPFINGIGLTIGNIFYLLWRLKIEKIKVNFVMSKIFILINLISFSFIGKVGSVISNNLDLFLVSQQLGPQSAAVLNLSRKGPEMSRTFIERPIIAFIPAISNMRSSTEIVKQKNIIIRLLKIILIIFGLIAVEFINFNDNFVNLWVGNNFFAGNLISFFICLNIILLSFSSNISNLCFALGEIRNTNLISFIQSIISLILLYVFINYFGLLGAVIAPIIGNLMLPIWYFPKLLIKQLSINHNELKKIILLIIKLFFLVLLLSILFFNIQTNNWFDFLLISITLAVIYTAITYVIFKDFRTEINSLINNSVNVIFQKKRKQNNY